MKYIYLTLALCLTLCTANAQTRLWTFNVQPANEYRYIQSMALNKDGSGAFVFHVISLNGPTTSKLVWVSSRGVSLLTAPLLSDNPYIDNRWEVVFASPTRLVASNGKIMYFYQFSRGKATLVKILRDSPVLFGGSTFVGWISIDGVYNLVPGTPEIGNPGDPGYQASTQGINFKNADTITAWTF